MIAQDSSMDHGHRVAPEDRTVTSHQKEQILEEQLIYLDRWKC